jgi:hypothetical protein
MISFPWCEDSLNKLVQLLGRFFFARDSIAAESSKSFFGAAFTADKISNSLDLNDVCSNAEWEYRWSQRHCNDLLPLITFLFAS